MNQFKSGKSCKSHESRMHLPFYCVAFQSTCPKARQSRNAVADVFHLPQCGHGKLSDSTAMSQESQESQGKEMTRNGKKWQETSLRNLLLLALPGSAKWTLVLASSQHSRLRRVGISLMMFVFFLCFCCIFLYCILFLLFSSFPCRFSGYRELFKTH
jgi:hypothetical protein